MRGDYSPDRDGKHLYELIPERVRRGKFGMHYIPIQLEGGRRRGVHNLVLAILMDVPLYFVNWATSPRASRK